MEQGGFYWKKGNESVQTDAASPNQIAENFEAIPIDAGKEIQLEIEQSPRLQVILWENTPKNNISLHKNKFNAPSEKGKYVYEVLAKWANGEVSFTFVVEVQ
jgi:hypothetical protein